MEGNLEVSIDRPLDIQERVSQIRERMSGMCEGSAISSAGVGEDDFSDFGDWSK